jgi:hypothetical protein
MAHFRQVTRLVCCSLLAFTNAQPLRAQDCANDPTSARIQTFIPQTRDGSAADRLQAVSDIRQITVVVGDGAGCAVPALVERLDA